MFIPNEYAKYFQHSDTNYLVKITFNVISSEAALIFPTLTCAGSMYHSCMSTG